MTKHVRLKDIKDRIRDLDTIDLKKIIEYTEEILSLKKGKKKLKKYANMLIKDEYMKEYILEYVDPTDIITNDGYAILKRGYYVSIIAISGLGEYKHFSAEHYSNYGYEPDYNSSSQNTMGKDYKEGESVGGVSFDEIIKRIAKCFDDEDCVLIKKHLEGEKIEKSKLLESVHKWDTKGENSIISQFIADVLLYDVENGKCDVETNHHYGEFDY